MNLSQHFTYEELTHSDTATRLGINNRPTEDKLENLRRLCIEVLEPARAILGVPLQVNSGYRCLSLNSLVGGSPSSAHMQGLAADMVPSGLDIWEAFNRLRSSEIPFDQIIFECNAWIHLGLRPVGIPPRHQALLASGKPGAWHYQEAPHA